MLIKKVNGKKPSIPEDCYIAENATIVGEVQFVNRVGMICFDDWLYLSMILSDAYFYQLLENFSSDFVYF